MAAFRSKHRRGGRLWLIGTTFVLMAAFATFFVAASGANLSGSTFESTDGNKAANGGKDWDNVAAHVGTDLFGSKSDDDAFGGGSSEDGPNVTVVNGSIPPQKSDLTKFYEFDE